MDSIRSAIHKACHIDRRLALIVVCEVYHLTTFGPPPSPRDSPSHLTPQRPPLTPAPLPKHTPPPANKKLSPLCRPSRMSNEHLKGRAHLTNNTPSSLRNKNFWKPSFAGTKTHYDVGCSIHLLAGPAKGHTSPSLHPYNGRARNKSGL